MSLGIYSSMNGRDEKFLMITVIAGIIAGLTYMGLMG